MNKLFFKILFIFLITVFTAGYSIAGIYPSSSHDIPQDTIGVYQTDKKIVVYDKPNQYSKIVYETDVHYSNLKNEKESYLFAILIPEKELSYLYVTDISEDENWVKVIYDKVNNSQGWMYKNDDFQFMPWISFINSYGRKYGVHILKNTNVDKVLSQPDEEGQVLGEIVRPKTIRLTAVEGIWLLVTILFYDNEIKTGYIKWRDTDGNIFIFPNFK